MTIIEAFDITTDKKESLCFVGAGGKTSALFAAAEALKAQGKKVLITTTTQIWYPKENQYDAIILSENKETLLKEANRIRKPGLYIIGRRKTAEGKLKGIESEWIDALFQNNCFDFILTEGDGSRQKPIKAPASHEPVIPAAATAVIGVIGLDCIGKAAAEEQVHRIEEFCRICGCTSETLISEKEITKLILHPEGLFKNAPTDARLYTLLNKADDETRMKGALNIKKIMENNPEYHIRISILLKEKIILK